MLRRGLRQPLKRLLSTANVPLKKPAAPSSSKGGGGGGGGSAVLIVSLFSISGIGYVAYKMEDDATFAETVKKNVPQVLPVLDPLRGLIRSSGLLESAKKKSSTTVPPVPAKVDTTSKSTDDAPPIAVVVKDDVKKVENKEKPAVVAAVTTPVVTPKAESVPTPAITKNTAPVAAAVAVAFPEQLTAAEVKARQLRLDAASELFDELSLQAVALRKELELSLLKDLHKLDADALRIRMTQLAAEFFERTKWESLRLHQSLRQVETDVARKYLELMNQQRIELETEMKRVIAAKEEQLTAHHAQLAAMETARLNEHLTFALHAQAEEMNETFAKEVGDKAEGIRSELQVPNLHTFSIFFLDFKITSQYNPTVVYYSCTIKSSYKDQLNHTMAVLRETHVKELLELQGQSSTPISFPLSSLLVLSHSPCHTHQCVLISRSIVRSPRRNLGIPCSRRCHGKYHQCISETTPKLRSDTSVGRSLNNIPTISSRISSCTCYCSERRRCIDQCHCGLYPGQCAIHRRAYVT